MATTLNKTLFYIILTTQKLQSLAISQEALYREFPQMAQPKDWLEQTREFFFGLPDEIVEKAEISLNEYHYEAVMRYEVTSELKSTSFDDLSRFPFKA